MREGTGTARFGHPAGHLSPPRTPRCAVVSARNSLSAPGQRPSAPDVYQPVSAPFWKSCDSQVAAAWTTCLAGGEPVITRR